jgi:cell division protease FtsH
MKQLLKNFGIIIVVLLSIAAAFSFAGIGGKKVEQVGINTLVDRVQEGAVTEVQVQGNTVYATLRDTNAPVLEVRKEYNQSFSELMEQYGVEATSFRDIEITIEGESGARFWVAALAPYIVPLLVLVAIIYFMSRQVQGANNKAMGFGQSRAKEAKQDSKHKKTFQDVAGAKEAKEELTEIVDFLKDPKKFAAMGATIPRGMLLMGPPGTGKTLMAKAIAGEAGVPFFHMSGSEFVEMFVGVGASRVRDLFNKAKKAAPAIVFIDEMDAVGRKRGAGLGGSHDEREQTLNQILVEMDGFEPNLGVIVVGATNRPDVLDKALLRPGRFDRRVIVDMPDIADREEILNVHAKGKPFAKDVDLKKLAERTPGFSGADLNNLLNEAAIRAVRHSKKEIDQEDILDSIEKVLMGPQRRSRIMTEHEREMTAYHEAGHAIVGHFLEHCDPVRKVTIIGRGRAGGYTLSMPDKDVRYQTRAQFYDTLAMILGGYVIEQLQYGEDALSTGPSSDLKKATQLATNMVTQYGMSDVLGPRQYGERDEMIFLAQEIHNKKNYSEKTAEVIDQEINRILEEAKTRAKDVIIKHKAQMDELVRHLLEKETVEQEEFNAIMNS